MPREAHDIKQAGGAQHPGRLGSASVHCCCVLRCDTNILLLSVRPPGTRRRGTEPPEGPKSA